MKTLFSKAGFTLAALTVSLVSLAGTAHASFTSFDTITGLTGYSIPSSSHTFMGEPFSMSSSAPGATTFVSSVDTALISTTATTYTDLVLNVELWGTYDATATGTTNVFSNSKGIYSFDFGPATLAANTAYSITGLTFSTPVDMGGYTNLGITFNWQGNTGTGLTSTDSLTTAVTTNAASAGSILFAGPNYGYFRNASGKTDFNFLSSDSRQIGANSALVFRLTNASAVVPEANTALLALAGFVPMVGMVIARRRKK